ncbi:MAG TPA: hypothetical protein VGM05_02645, partial [Planctomycetaceae bacterium]
MHLTIIGSASSDQLAVEMTLRIVGAVVGLAMLMLGILGTVRHFNRRDDPRHWRERNRPPD